MTWEGDVENSAPLNGFTENLTFNGTPLVDALNPLNNQFNSTLNQPGTTTEYGTDIDRYDVSALLSPGDTSSTTVYSSGGDLVILTLEVIAVSNTETADLGIDKSHTGDFLARQNNDYSIVVSNQGPSVEAATITVTDTLPAGLTFVSGTGAGWACAAAGQDVTCTNNTATAAGDDFPELTLTVFADLSSVPGVVNTASVTSPTFDNQGGNNSDTDATNIVDEDPSLIVLKASETIVDPVNGTTDPKAIPGADVRYSIIVSNAGIGPVDNGSLIITDSLPEDTALFVDTAGGPPITFSDGTPSSELTFDYATDIAFTDAPGGAGPFDYVPTPDADGYDAAITGFEIRPSGIFVGNVAPSSPSQFTLNFVIRLQ
ncbi:MAG: hypothetical protein AAAFM81_03520 [Pseudomonadota bacterium]